LLTDICHLKIGTPTSNEEAGEGPYSMHHEEMLLRLQKKISREIEANKIPRCYAAGSFFTESVDPFFFFTKK